MIVAGDHAKNDMAGTVQEGLGSNDEFAEIFVDHIRDTAKEHGMVLE